VNILDENILESQRQVLRSQRIPIRQIGHDVGRKGMKDDEIIPLLCGLRRPTFFTRDFGFYERGLCHTRYCLVCMVVRKNQVAAFVRRLFRHPEFNTQAKRMGTIIRVSQGGLRVWRLYAEREIILSWSD